MTWLVFILTFEEMYKWNLSFVNIFTLLTLVPHKKNINNRRCCTTAVSSSDLGQQKPMPQDNWWGNLKVEHNVTCCIPFSLVLNLKDCCLLFYCSSYISAEFITIVQASLSNGQSMVQLCNKSFSAHWDYFTFFPFFSCNFFFFFFFRATVAQCQTFHPFPFLLDMNPPSKPWGFTKTLKCIIRMKPGARQPKAPMASLLHTTHPTIWLAASL